MTIAPNGDRRSRNLIVFLPLIVFLALAALFFFRLGVGDPQVVPSALIGRPAPATNLPPLTGVERDGKALPGITPELFAGKVTLVNVWASWCPPCHEEAPLLLQLSQDKRIQIVGINNKDAPDNARRFLSRYGNPFMAVGTDSNGREAIEWGVYLLPQTFLVGRDGRIIFKFFGAITPESLSKQVKPLIEKALAAS